MTISLKLARGGQSSGSGASSVSLDGDPLIQAGTSEVYQITNYNVFSTYSATVTGGTVAINGDQITLTVPAGYSGPQIGLTVTRDGNPSTFLIAVGASTINTPTIIFPANGAANQSTTINLESSGFSTSPAGLDTHVSSRWQVSTNSSFTNIVYDSGETTTNLRSVVVSNLNIATTYYARVRYTGANMGTSAWSPTISFSTSSASVNAPIVSIVGGTVEVGETPTFATNAFSVSSSTDSHSATDWQVVRQSDSAIIWQSLGNTVNRTSITIPSGLLVESTNYSVRARHIGARFGPSNWTTLQFRTADSFFVFGPQSAGRPLAGGYYAGANIVINGIEYAVIVSPRDQGQVGGGPLEDSIRLMPPYAGGSHPGAPATGPFPTFANTTENDGATNTTRLLAYMGGFSSQAINFVRGLNIDGYTDWYIPSKSELEIAFRYLKPTAWSNAANDGQDLGVNQFSSPPGTRYSSSTPGRTSVDIFKNGGSESFTVDRSIFPGQNDPLDAINFMTSTQSNQDYNDFWTQEFGRRRYGTNSIGTGRYGTGMQMRTSRSTYISLRAFRKIPIST